MNKVFFSIGLSLDGYMVPRGMDLAHADNLGEQPWFRQPITLAETIDSTDVTHMRYMVNG